MTSPPDFRPQTRGFRGCPTWTRTDEHIALSQGWGLFAVDSGDVVIQKLDDPPEHHLWEEGMPEEQVFDSDSQAIRCVRSKARQGDATARKAINTHDRNIASWRRWKRAHGHF